MKFRRLKSLFFLHLQSLPMPSKNGDQELQRWGVTKDIPDNEIWAGNPAKFIMMRDGFEMEKE